MSAILLTQYDGKILGPIAILLGYLIDGIFNLLDKIGLPNTGLAIILLTLIIYIALMPLTIKQQKFSKLSAKMNPEIQAIQAKYKDKKDQDSMVKMNAETKAVYAKYGVSPSGSCVQLIIQMPIYFALYRVIYSIPAYVTKVKDAFSPFVDKFVDLGDTAVQFINNKDNFANVITFSKQFENELFVSGNKEYITNTFIDVLNKASTAEWKNLYDKFPNLQEFIFNSSQTGAADLLNRYNSFLGLNVANSPKFYVTDCFKNGGSVLLLIGGLLIPVLAGLTQWLNTKLMPQQPQQNNGQDTMAATMKSMNIMMPIMSVVFCFSFPVGLGIYWIAGAVIRCIQQVIINKHLDKIDIDEQIKKNVEKYNKKLEKQGVSASTVRSNASLSTKAYVDNKSLDSSKNKKTQAEKDEALKKSTDYYNKNAKPGSLAAKANMVKQYNEKNNYK